MFWVGCAAQALLAVSDPPAFSIVNEAISNPASAHSPKLVRGDSSLFLTWLEKTSGSSVLRLSTYDAKQRTWTPARTLHSSVSATSRYLFAPGSGRHLAVITHHQASCELMLSEENGETWSEPKPLSHAGITSLDTPSILEFLADGRLALAWLRPVNDTATALHMAILSNDASVAESRFIESPISPGSRPALVAFPDGGALLAWRGLSEDGVHDIYTTRLETGRWTPPARLMAENWKPPAAPADGPVLASRGAHLASAWFNATDDPRVNVSVSSSAGEQWLMPQRVDDVRPRGRPSLVMLDDGSNLVSWIEREGGSESLFLRRLSPRGTLNVPVRIATAVEGHPQLVRVKDGDATPAEVMVLYTPASSASQPEPAPVTRLLTLPDAALLAEADSCDCDPRPEDQRGYGIKGRIVSVDAKAGAVTLAHDGVPGVMKGATDTFRAAPDVLAAVTAGKRIFARIERIGPDWWLFNPRTLVIP